jgi:hypothetical protein
MWVEPWKVDLGYPCMIIQKGRYLLGVVAVSVHPHRQRPQAA